MKFVIFHGAFGSPEDNWFPELKEKLEALGQEVLVPKFPVDDWDTVTQNGPSAPIKNQTLNNWFKAFEQQVLSKIKKTDKLCFIGHSLGPVFILHVVSKYNLKLDSAIFVGPFLDRLNRFWQIDHANASFYKIDFDFAKIQKQIPVSYVLHSDNDPYVDRNHSILFAKALGSSIIFVKKAGHMNSEVNLNEFPLVFDLCNTRLDLTIYQKYIAHRNEFLDYITPQNRSLLNLKVNIRPDEIYDEGKFKFSHLKYGGFCTFPTGFKGWDPKNSYTESCRRAARRTKNITRVFLVEDVKDLNRHLIQQQIKLDVAGGVNVGLCLFSAVKDELPKPSFGIWDDEYVCIENYHHGKVIDEIELDSRSFQIKTALKWQKVIKKYTTFLKNYPQDLNDFAQKHSSK